MFVTLEAKAEMFDVSAGKNIALALSACGNKGAEACREGCGGGGWAGRFFFSIWAKLGTRDAWGQSLAILPRPGNKSRSYWQRFRTAGACGPSLRDTCPLLVTK